MYIKWIVCEILSALDLNCLHPDKGAQAFLSHSKNAIEY